MGPFRSAMVCLAASTLLFASCSSGGEITEQLLESQEGVSDVEIDEDTGRIEMETDDASVVLGGGEIPADFPIDVPSGGTVQSVVSTDEGVSVTLAYTADYADIRGAFEEWIESSGHVVDDTFESTQPPRVSWAIDAGDAIYFIQVAEAGEGSVQVGINVTG